jgi:hypothetical protein
MAEQSSPQRIMVLALFPCALCQNCRDVLQFPRDHGQRGEKINEYLPSLSLQLLQHLVQFSLKLTNLVRDLIICFILTLYGQEVIVVC